MEKKALTLLKNNRKILFNTIVSDFLISKQCNREKTEHLADR